MTQPRNVENIYTLSPVQEGMLFHTLYATDTGMYVGQMDITLRGDLCAEYFQRAWRQVMQRHTVLRTMFLWERRERPLQVVLKEAKLPWEVYDWLDLSLSEREERLKALLSESRIRCNQLSQAPLMQLHLIRWDDDTYRLLWSFHHLILDGWSISLLLNEVFEHYHTCCTGRPIHQEIPRPYSDYISWLQRQDLREAEKFWRDALKGFTTPLELRIECHKVDNKRSGNEHAQSEYLISSTTFATLRSLARQHRLTLNTIMQGLWALLLGRYSGEDDIVFGTTVAGRPASLPGAETMIGLFINTLPVRTRILPDEPVLSWLKDLQPVLAEIRQYEYTPLADIQKWSEVPRGTPLFESIVVFENYPLARARHSDESGLRVERIDALDKSHYPLTLIVQADAYLSFRLVYDAQRYEREAMQRLLEHLGHLLEAVVSQPDQPIGTLPLLSATEEHLLLERWNPAEQPEAVVACLHEQFAQQASRTPDAIALQLDETQLSYQQLDHQANQLAWYLRSQGVGPEVLVGLCLPRSFELIIGLLAILKAGGAYVPLDPGYPAERLAFMVTDAQLKLVLSSRQTRQVLPLGQVRCLEVEGQWGWEAGGVQEAPESGVRADNLAYVIYTSGSTGHPKGTLVSHLNVERLFAATVERLSLSARDTWTLFHSFSFDFSVWEIWGALLQGGRLVVVPHALARSPDDFLKALSRFQVTVLNQTPSAFRALDAAESGEERPLPLSLRLLIFGGEALSPAWLQGWFKRHPDDAPTVINMYGITETTVHVTLRQMRAQELPHLSGSPIGQALADLHLYLLDERMQLVPIGVPGELYIGGPGLARGYLCRPELTAERFLPHPFSSLPGARLYRSGDLARYLPDGELFYLGRADQQLKIRGFRIEPGEIESCLRAHAAIRDALVMAREAEPPAPAQLVAYLLLRHLDSAPALESLREFVQERLPQFMVPASFVFLTDFPLTASGKVDRRALPAPESQRAQLQTAYVAPRTPVEEALAQIWAEVLHVERVGVADNFFALGGDSIRSIQILARGRAVGLSFTLAQLFEQQTIARLAALEAPSLDSVAPQEASGPFCLISSQERAALPEGIMDAYPLSMLQSGMLYGSMHIPGSYYNVTSLHIETSLHLAAFGRALQLLIERHPLLRTSFWLNQEGKLLQLVHVPENVPLSLLVTNLHGLTPAEQQSVLVACWQAEPQQPFDWHVPPLFRVHLHLLSPGAFQLTFTDHHAILDGWSVSLLLKELLENYRQACLSPQLAKLRRPALQASYRDFVALEQQVMAVPAIQQFWQGYLQGATPTRLPDLRGNQQQSETSTQPTAVYEVEFGPSRSQAIEQLARQAGVPIKSVLLAVHLRVMSMLSGRYEVLTGVVSHGRLETQGGEEVLGLFLNTLPFRQKLSGGNWIRLIQEVFQMELRLLPYRRYPLAQIQQDTGGLSLFETVFNFVHFYALPEANEHNIQNLAGRSAFTATDEGFTLAVHFHVVPHGKGQLLNMTLFANRSEEQVRMIGRYYQHVLETMLAHPYAHYEEISPFAEHELQRLAQECIPAVCEEPASVCLHQLFENQVQRTPEAIAILSGELQLSYQELDSCASQLAHFLSGQGVGPEVVVGVCLERSAEMVIALLAVLKAGGAYALLDPNYPPEQLNFLLQQSHFSMLLTRERLRNGLPDHNIRLICLDTVWESAIALRYSRLVEQVRLENVANIMYTSGLMDQPKLVAIEHRNAASIIQERARYYEPVKRALLLPSPACPISLEIIFWTLESGGMLVLPSEVNLARLAEPVAQYQPSHFIATPSLYALALEQANSFQMASLQTVIVSGEVCPMALVQRHYQQLPNKALFNEYGVPESCAWSTYHGCTASIMEMGVPLGRPIANSQVYILNEQMQPLPIGTPGEVYVGGVGIARGYLRNADLTAKSFVPHPFSKRPGARLFRTGDLARYRLNGAIEYLGSRDERLEIQGYDIEPGVIETILAGHPQVKNAFATAYVDKAAAKHLTAYIVPSRIETFSMDEIKIFLSSRLPEYMVPDLFIPLQELPLSLDGKVSRKLLPVPDNGDVRPQAQYEAPRTATEKWLATLWRELLGTEDIGIHNTFFELGGHSLLLLQFHLKLTEHYKRDIPIAELFAHPTIGTLAEYLDGKQLISTTSPSNIRDHVHKRADFLQQRRQLRQERSTMRKRE